MTFGNLGCLAVWRYFSHFYLGFCSITLVGDPLYRDLGSLILRPRDGLDFKGQEEGLFRSMVTVELR